MSFLRQHKEVFSVCISELVIVKKMDTDENLIFLKYLRFLSLKFTNAIVQSRLGGIVTTRCNSAGTDWVSEARNL